LQRRRFLQTSLAASAASLVTSAQTPSAGAREYYELRRYHLRSGSTKLIDTYLAEAFLPALNRLGIMPVGAFNLYIGPETPALYLLLPSTSLNALVTTEARLLHDDEYQKAAQSFLTATAKEPAYERIDSSLMIAFEGWPKLKVPAATAQKGSRVFQLRTYESAGIPAHQRKIEMFQSGEFDIFEKAGFWNVFFGDTLIGDRLPNLTYMLSFPDLAELNAKWSAFSSNPDWKKLVTSPRYNYEPIVTNISNLILNPTSYSQI
jgi:hypothetical protein